FKNVSQASRRRALPEKLLGRHIARSTPVRLEGDDLRPFGKLAPRGSPAGVYLATVKPILRNLVAVVRPTQPPAHAFGRRDLRRQLLDHGLKTVRPFRPTRLEDRCAFPHVPESTKPLHIVLIAGAPAENWMTATVGHPGGAVGCRNRLVVLPP